MKSSDSRITNPALSIILFIVSFVGPVPAYMPLTSIGENHFSVDYYGEPAKLKFSLDDDGNAFAMSVEQQGHEIKLPRK